MFNTIVIGGGIAGLNLCSLLKNKSICLIERDVKLGGLIQTKYYNKLKYESGGAVVYDYQKNMLGLIKKYNIDTKILKMDKKDRHIKRLYDCKQNGPLADKMRSKFYTLMKKVLNYIDTKPKSYCRKFTFEQICLQVISFEETRFLEFCYGYSGEFRVANALTAKKNIENELFNSKQIILFKDGYSKLLKKIVDEIKDYTDIKLKTEVVRFEKSGNKFKVYTNNKKVLVCNNLVFCIPQQALVKIEGFSSKEHELFNSIEGIDLCRVFAKYDVNKNNWIQDLSFSTINNPIRQIIPVSSKNGFFQISYSDWYFAKYWGEMSKNEIIITLNKLLKDIFCSKKYSNPIWIKKYYWKNAIHFWKPNFNEQQLSKDICNIRKNMYIGGESFSLNQGWAEGAIQTSITIARLINKQN